MVELVSSNSPDDLAKEKAKQKTERARHDVMAALVQLTANLLRVTRGAGRPGAIIPMAMEFIEACAEYRNAAGLNPAPEYLAEALMWQRDFEYIMRFDEFNQAHIEADEKMARGALQIVASRLLGQNTQESAGHNELYQGMHEWEEIRDRRNREMFGPKLRGKPTKPRRRPKLE
jgi:hypothetical protein